MTSCKLLKLDNLSGHHGNPILSLPNNFLSTHPWSVSSNLAEAGWIFSFRPAFTLGSLALGKRKGWEGDRQNWARPLPSPLVSVGVATATRKEKEEKSAEERER